MNAAQLFERYIFSLLSKNPHDSVVPFAVTTKALTLSGSKSRRVKTTEPHVSPFPADRASDIVHFLT